MGRLRRSSQKVQIAKLEKELDFILDEYRPIAIKAATFQREIKSLYEQIENLKAGKKTQIDMSFLNDKKIKKDFEKPIK